MTKTARVLLVDDSPTDLKLVHFAARQSRWIKEIRDMNNGREALDFLTVPPDSPAWVPHLILIDLNMPKMNGFELLESLKSDPKLKLIPTVVFTTSSAPSDIKKAYSHHANSFVTKPPDFETLVECLRTIEDFWLGLAARATHPDEV